nr:MAG TPA: hypothetical protein [Caudoviricetes sp.]
MLFCKIIIGKCITFVTLIAFISLRTLRTC